VFLNRVPFIFNVFYAKLKSFKHVNLVSLFCLIASLGDQSSCSYDESC
jgi:hypothetical protein